MMINDEEIVATRKRVTNRCFKIGSSDDMLMCMIDKYWPENVEAFGEVFDIDRK